MMINGRYTGKYKVVNFIAYHNGHDLVSPSKTHFLRSHRRITDVQALQADDISSSGIAPRAGYHLMSKQVGGRENVGFIFEDYKNYMRSKRTMEMKIGVLEYLQQKQLVDPNFFYAIHVDEDDLITNIIWVDAQMMVDYSHFGDVVSFDTTYRKNKEGRPFALFVGVNHHKQTIVFGAALLYDETASTFTWLFDTFARAMSGKQPKTILTDQDAAMAKALAITWPNTLIDERGYQELKADLRTCHSTPVASFPVEIIKHAASVYTHEVFELFQDELRKAYDSQIELCGEIGETPEYKITPFKKHHQHTVMYDSSHALTDETFTLAKTGILKMIEEVEVKLENMTAVSPNIESKSIGKKALVSRVDEQRSVGASLNPGNAFDDVNTASSDILIKG
ncbi:protein FAR1-RELATED SEQUENCE 5 [Sesamum alatum]|uniref:Protein FAR1-RELATED SEQUENCE 5 n=1 Tax=Sesamum alatum TaxID=300844 RepID=A0AAE1YAN6_9LAMI|nr:protein FAR1-RELATED SEQUENCE 5 [Sesamum alatum]